VKRFLPELRAAAAKVARSLVESTKEEGKR
jgi:hypothetical protein